MFPKSSLVISPVSGFVAFDGGGAVTPPAVSYPTLAPASARAPVVARAPLADVAVEAAPGLRQSPSWQAASTSSVRLVEAVVILSICAHFAYGAARLFNLI